MSQSIQDIVQEVVYCVRVLRDFDKATQIIAQNSFSVEQLAKSTIRLDMFDIAKLADKLVNLNK